MDQRIAADRLWRDETARRQFEAECGMSPISETEAEQQEQITSGHTQDYHDKFCGWAAKKLGLPYISAATVKEFKGDNMPEDLSDGPPHHNR